MSYDVLEDRMYKGLKKVISDKTNLSAFSEHNAVKGVEYVFITNEDMETTLPGAGSSTFVGVFNVDYYTNSKNMRTVRNNKSKLMETLADNDFYRSGTTDLYFNGEILSIEHGTEDDDWVFRIVYQISHTKITE